MRTALDARLIGMPGIGRFIAGLWSGLLQLGADPLVLWNDRRARSWLGDERAAPLGPVVTVRARPFGPAEQVVVPRLLGRHHVDVLHAPHFSIPHRARVPLVMTIHDLFPYLEPENARSGIAAAYYRLVMPRAVRRATAIVAVSPFAAEQVTDVFGVGDDRLHVVEHGLDHERWRPAGDTAVEEVRRRWRIDGPYLLYVGTAKRHKNLATVLAALDPAAPPLVLAGPTASEVEATAGAAWPSAGGRARALGRVPDDDLPALYTGATALVLPSLYEAVGLTALEAMACGTPVVASDGGGLPRTVGDAGFLVAPTDVDGWRAAIATVVGDADLRARMVAAGTALAAARTWLAAARQYTAIYEAVA